MSPEVLIAAIFVSMLIKMVRLRNNVGKKPEKNTGILSDEISKKGEVSWSKVLDVADPGELVYKLTLKSHQNLQEKVKN